MAKWIEHLPAYKRSFAQWFESRPQCIKDTITKYNLYPDVLFRLGSTGHRVIVNSVNEMGTVSVIVCARFNKDMGMREEHERCVYGIDPADLEECDLPPGVEIYDPTKHYN